MTPTLKLEDLIQRPPAVLDQVHLEGYLSSRTVLVTGAGGSIGRELSALLLSLRPKKLVLVDFSEYHLFLLEQQLKADHRVVFCLTDVRRQDRMEALLREHRPDVVFHAAAYKHVPMMEVHPAEAFENNTLASIQLLRSCEQENVEQFIFISTDKAVAPRSVMGATKRFAEWYVRSANGTMKTKTVRFGNVFGSLGSVVPLFERQIAAGGPVTVTHIDMERFFMSVQDACGLILETLLLDDAPVYTLRMDPAIRIQWLAERMIETLNPDPDRSIPITYIGIRPGEKMQEQLWEITENPIPTRHEHILGLQGQAQFSRSELDAYLLQLQLTANTGDPAQLAASLFDFPMTLVNP